MQAMWTVAAPNESGHPRAPAARSTERPFQASGLAASRHGRFQPC
jgi:hypothetical protein